MGSIQSSNLCESKSPEQFLLATYFDLRKFAETFLKRNESAHITHPTALVHEAAVRLLRRDRSGFNNREHFFRTMVREMRRVLVDAARKRKHRKHQSLSDQAPIRDVTVSGLDPVEILALDEALSALERTNPANAQIAELRLLGGLSHSEIASLMSISERTVERKWACARSQLAVTLEVNCR
jgi:RNA polymerase sigma factor (TIGR02999 family)